MTNENPKLTEEPGDSPRSSRPICSIFELVDATDDETYYALGLYLDLSEAIADAMTGDTPPTDSEEYVLLEIRERPLGFSGCGRDGKLAATVEWQQVLDEEKDDWVWRRSVLSNTSVSYDRPQGGN